MLKLKWYVLFESNREKIKCILNMRTSNYGLICELFNDNCIALLLFTIVFCYKYLNAHLFCQMLSISKRKTS